MTTSSIFGLKKLFLVPFVLLLAVMTLDAKSVPAYFDAPYADTAAVKSKLKGAGFSVLADYHPAGKSSLNVLVYTNAQLKAAAKGKKAFAAVQRVMIDSGSKKVRVSNPEYWLKAFLQGSYNGAAASAVKKSLEGALGSLKPGKDALSSGKLSGYHFMLGMPYYQDMIKLGSKAGVKGGKKVFELNVGGGKLIGVKLSGKTEGFINKIGKKNALLLPYMVLIKGGKAYMLHPKYYIAIAYPSLSMSQFMKISDIPDAIEDEIKAALK